MRKNKKTLFALYLSVSMVFMCNTQVFASVDNQMGMYVNNNKVNVTNKPFIKDGRTYVPIRIVGDLLGVETEFDNNTKTVTIKNDNTTAKFLVGDNTYEVNGKKYSSKVTPLFNANRVYVPLRIVGEVFGAEISIDSKTQSIIINFKDNAISNSKDTYNNILKDFYMLTDDKIAKLSAEEIEQYIETYNVLKGVGVNDEVLGVIQNDTNRVLSEVINSQEFDDFSDAILNSESFKSQIDEVIKSKDFIDLIRFAIDSKEYQDLVNELKLQKEYKAFAEDVKMLPAYNEVVKEYGEEITLLPLYSGDLTIDEYVNLLSKLLNDDLYVKFLQEATGVESFNAYQNKIANLLSEQKNIEFWENIKTSESYNVVKEQISLILTKTIKELPESKAVKILFDQRTLENLGQINK